MRFLLLSLPAMLAMSMNLHAAETAAIPLAVSPNADEFVTRTNEATGAIELQKEDGSWQVVAVRTTDLSQNEDGDNRLPIVKVQYYGGAGYYGYGYDCPPGYIPPPPPPPAPCCGGPVVVAPPVYYPAPVPRVYYGGAYYNPYRSYYGGGYGYNHWRRW